jgi:hypothetical protein
VNPFYLIKHYFNEAKFWVKRQFQGDLRPVTKPSKTTAAKAPATKKRTQRKKTK